MRLEARLIVAIVIAFIVLMSGSPVHAGDPQSALEDSRVTEVLATPERVLSLDVILTKIEDIGSFPELNGTDLVCFS